MTIYYNPLFGGPLPNQDLPDAYADAIQAGIENQTTQAMREEIIKGLESFIGSCVEDTTKDPA